LDKFKQNSIKLKFRTVGGVDKRVLCRKKAEQLRDKLDKLSEKQDQLSMTKGKTNWKTRRY
jgi:hypothetical protein